MRSTSSSHFLLPGNIERSNKSKYHNFLIAFPKDTEVAKMQHHDVIFRELQNKTKINASNSFRDVYNFSSSEANNLTNNGTTPTNFSWHPSGWSNTDKHLAIALSIWMLITLVLTVSFAFFSFHKRINLKTINASKLIQRKKDLVLVEIEKTKILVTEDCFKEGSSLLVTPAGNAHVIDPEVARSQDNEDTVTPIEKVNPHAPMKQLNECIFGDDKPSSSCSVTLTLPQYDIETMEAYPNGGPRQILPSCAICLGSYMAGDHICWSANVECCHAFHQKCILQWCIQSIKTNPGANHCACPCCRHFFVKLDENEYW